ncbi:hypothetical protein BB560_003440 [Smittium megazygosporum]|uniref:Uncharacterized protein n=1 Tax=Smittium megazygosporum TaxID=133381 RepID=A0A2T9ZC00_9FUNG|nr:hypothetical protein BB560_003440 [Smittium megazygosporum]
MNRQHAPFSKTLKCYELYDPNHYTDKIIAPQSLLSEIIEYFKSYNDRTKSADNTERNVSAVKARTKSKSSHQYQGTPLIRSSRKIHGAMDSDIDAADSKNVKNPLPRQETAKFTKNFSNFLDHEDDSALIPSPLTFSLSKHTPQTAKTSNQITAKSVCVGIKEFTSEESLVGIPKWIMQELGLKNEDTISLEYKKLPKGTFAQFFTIEPLKSNSNVDLRAIMESFMRKNLTTLSEGQTIQLNSENFECSLQVSRLEPANQVDIVDTDLSVDIEQPNLKNSFGSEPSTLSTDLSHINLVLDVEKSATVDSFKPLWLVFDFNSVKSNPSLELELVINNPSGDLDVFARKGLLLPSELNFEKCDVSGSLEEKSIIINKKDTNTEFGNFYSFAVYPYNTQHVSFTYILKPLIKENTPENSATTTEILEDGIKCKNCNQVIIKRSYLLHEATCYRNNAVCEMCNSVVLKKDLEAGNHTHCELCDFIGSSYEVEKHTHYFHEPVLCPDCPDIGGFLSFMDLSLHRSSSCPSKVIVCRFCHTFVKQGKLSTSPEDILEGFHEHESYCGSRTIQCEICKKNVQLKKIKIHAQTHQLAKQAQGMPFKLCSNTECRYVFDPSPKDPFKSNEYYGNNISGATKSRFYIDNCTSNPLNLCERCFVPLIVLESDPENKILMQRIVNALFRQLMYGCGKSYCMNNECATGNPSVKYSANEAAQHILPSVKSIIELVNNKKNQKAAHPLSLCIDYMCFKHRSVVDRIQDHLMNVSKKQNNSSSNGQSSRPMFSTEWISLAVTKCDLDYENSLKWLYKFAPTS